MAVKWMLVTNQVNVTFWRVHHDVSSYEISPKNTQSSLGEYSGCIYNNTERGLLSKAKQSKDEKDKTCCNKHFYSQMRKKILCYQLIKEQGSER